MATLYHQLWINAPAAKVYEAISNADGLTRWWGPHESTETDTGLVLSHNLGPEHGVVRLKVLESIHDKRVEWECISTHPKSSPASAWTGTHFVWEISERDMSPLNPGLAKTEIASQSWIFATPAGMKTVSISGSATLRGAGRCEISSGCVNRSSRSRANLALPRRTLARAYRLLAMLAGDVFSIPYLLPSFRIHPI